jgi:hypothetical protein
LRRFKVQLSESHCVLFVFLDAGAAVSDGIFLYAYCSGVVVQYDPEKPDEGELCVNMQTGKNSRQYTEQLAPCLFK